MGKKTKQGKGRLDKYYHLAKDQGYRARSAFKLVQLAKKFDFLSKSKVCIDLCGAPGGWSQVAQRNMPSGSLIICVDLAPIKPLYGVVCMQTDITTDKCRQMLKKEMKGSLADCVLHDGAPNVGTSWSKDAYEQNELTLMSMKIACEHLRPGGTFVTKVFRSSDYNSLLWVFNQLFNKVDATKPTASRNVSAEIFVMCIGFKGGKVDPRFFEPKWVFMENAEAMSAAKEAAIAAGRSNKDGPVKPSISLTEHFKSRQKKHRGGYEDGDDHKVATAHDFIASEEPAIVLITHHKIDIKAKGSEHILADPLTNEEVTDLCGDLKILGKKDLSRLLKWRMMLIRQKERKEREALRLAAALEKQGKAQKALKAKAEGAEGPAEDSDGETERKPTKKASGGGNDDVDDAISKFLDDDDAADTGKALAEPKAKGAGAGSGALVAQSSSSEDDMDEKIDGELKGELEKKRRSDKRDKRKMMDRQKKRELKKKMNMGKAKGAQNEEELFKGVEKGGEDLDEDDAYINEMDDEDEDSDEDGTKGAPKWLEEDSDDDEMDRLARMEVDIAIDTELRNHRAEDKHRSKMQRVRKGKKETRRQQVMAAWSGEFSEFAKAIDNQAATDMALQDQEDESDSDGDLAYIRDIQKARLALTAKHSSTVDGGALEALMNGPVGLQARAEARKADKGSDEEEGGEDDEDDDDGPVGTGDPVADAKNEARMARWFGQDIFKHASAKDESDEEVGGGIIPVDKSEDEAGSGEEDQIAELDDSQLPKLPRTDKEKRKLARAKENDWLIKTGRKPKGMPAEEVGPLEIAELEPPKPLVPVKKKGPQKPDDPRELAETLALGSLLVDSKKSRMEVIDAAYNRWTFDGDEGLPDWFTEEESKYMTPELPISKELMQQFRSKLREINARPIRKVAEARARKRKRMMSRIDKLRATAMSLSDNPEMSANSKAQQMRKAMRKEVMSDVRKVTVVGIKKSGGGRSKDNKAKGGKSAPGAKVKVVDRRMKNDRRMAKKNAKHNPSKAKAMVRKQGMKQQKKASRGRARAGGVKGPGITGRATA